MLPWGGRLALAAHGLDLYRFLFDLTDGEGWPLLFMRRWVGQPRRPVWISLAPWAGREGTSAWGLSEAPFALMRPGPVELAHPDVEVGLQVVDRRVELLAEGDAIELVKHGFVETLLSGMRLVALRCPAVPGRGPAIWCAHPGHGRAPGARRPAGRR